MENKRFFLVVPVQMERLALYEMVRHLGDWGIHDPQFEIFPGGVEVLLPLEIGLRLNSVLKIPVRILLRVIEKETKTEKEFEALLKEANLKQFAPLGEVYVSSRSSFLRFKKSLEETVYDFVGYKPKSSGTSVFLRFFRDVCTISVNTSGEDLFRRGYDKWVGEAPVRDNIAAGLMQLVLKGISDTTPIELIDPMAGSGTLLLEAFLKNRVFDRSYAYEKWPNPIPKFTHAPASDPVWSLFASDLNKKNVETIQNNGKVTGVPMSVSVEDLFSPKKRPKSKVPRVVVCNPPYGKRLKTTGDWNYFNDVLEKIVYAYSPERIGMLTPRVWLEHANYEKMYDLDMENSGIETRFTVLYRSDVQ
ncbi:MAG: hypothetical protein IT287_06695 [Bdellovibrionaceae bacterium]|nr:hypothetical protein [Pseudobdellovibrionaceae bacterium]